MTVFEARRWIIGSSLAMAAATFVFFILAPMLGYPLRFSQTLSIMQIVFPVFIGYLGAASQFVFQKSPPANDTTEARPLMAWLVYGPIGLFALMMAVTLSAFGYSNRAAAEAGDGMSVEQFRLAITAIMGVLAATTSVATAWLFAVPAKPKARTPKQETTQ